MTTVRTDSAAPPHDETVDRVDADPADATPLCLARPPEEESDRLEQLSAALNVPVIDDLKDRTASASFVERVPIAYARRHCLLGLSGNGVNGAALPIAVSDVEGWDVLDVLSRLLDRPVEPVLAPRDDVLAAINQAYQQRGGQADAMIQRLDAADLPEGVEQLPGALPGGREDLLDVATRAPVIKLVNLILFEAVKQFASDVHVQPYEDKLITRLRIDGVLFDAYELPRALAEEMTSRIKVMGRMNIAEKRLAQDGRATVQVGDRVIDLRISCVPTSHGERVVIRLLDKSARLYTLGELGMDGHTLDNFRGLIHVEHGLMLVTGPTGSGKSTTLYAALHELNSKALNVLTLEDPIEYQLTGVSQIQVSDKKGMTFAGGLRSVLRQDPDIIMVGEIRDRETAVLAIQSALTGHLVFSTLHTNDAPSAMTRLLDLGIEPYLAASSVVGVLAQRLVRRVCPDCGEAHTPGYAELGRLDLDLATVDVSDMAHRAWLRVLSADGLPGSTRHLRAIGGGRTGAVAGPEPVQRQRHQGRGRAQRHEDPARQWDRQGDGRDDHGGRGNSGDHAGDDLVLSGPMNERHGGVYLQGDGLRRVGDRRDVGGGHAETGT